MSDPYYNGYRNGGQSRPGGYPGYSGQQSLPPSPARGGSKLYSNPTDDPLHPRHPAGPSFYSGGSDMRSQGRTMSNHNYYVPDGGLRPPGKPMFGANEDVTEESDDTKKKRAISRVLNKYAGRCSMNGVPFIAQSRNKRVKTIWSILLLVAIACMAIHLYLLISTYLSHKKQTEVKLSFSSLQFPAVTVCNVNPIRMSMRGLASDDLNAFIDSVNPENMETLLEEWEPDYETVEDYYDDDDGFDLYNDDRRRRRRRSANNARIRSSTFIDEINLISNSTKERQTVIDNFYDENDQDSWSATSTTSAFYQLEQTFQEYLGQENKTVRARMGHQIHDMLLQCSFAGGKCVARNFTRVQSSVYGNCYTLQYPKFVSRRSGPADGLELKLFLDTSEYVPGIANSKGISVVVHDQGTLPFPEEEGLAAMAGTETYISLKQVQISRLGSPFGDCTPIHHFKKSYGVKYTRYTCQKVCEELRRRRQCKCYNQQALEINRLLKTPSTMRPCVNTTEVLCSLRISNEFQSDNTACNCHSPCSETTFEKTVSFREWPNPPFAKLLKATVCKHNETACPNLEQMSDELLRREFIKLVVYYEDLNYEELEESQDYEDEQFVSDVGGTVGLWIGLSILSVFELFQLFYDLVAYICFGRWKTSSPEQRYAERR